MNIESKLTVLHDDNGVFSDYTFESSDYIRDTYSLTLVSAEDSLYIGFKKPISAYYIAFSTPSTNAATLSLSYYNGVSFTPVSDFHDGSKGLTRDGMTQWSRNQENEEVTTVNSLEKYWYKINISADSSAMVIKGLNIIFSDDEDIKPIFPEYAELYPNGETTHLLSHRAARDEIIQELRNNGYYTEDINTGRKNDINPFDILNVDQLRVASSYLALSYIFSNVSDSPDDLYHIKSEKYRSLYNSALKMFYLDIDEDDDGISDYDEELAAFHTGIIRR